MTSGYSTNRIFILAGGYLIMQRDHIYLTQVHNQHTEELESLELMFFLTIIHSKPITGQNQFDVSALIK